MSKRRAIVVLVVLLLLGGAMIWKMLRDSAPATGDRAIPSEGIPAEPFVLAVLGTSLTAASPWPEILADQLAECLGSPVTLVRAARSGANSETGLAQVEDVAAASPDLVLIEFAINDADLRGGVWLARSEQLHREMIARLGSLSAQSRVVFVTMNPARGLRGWVRPRLAAYEAMYRRLADALPVGLIDLAPIWHAALASGAARTYLPDGLHPTEAAVTEIALPHLLARTSAVFGSNCGS